MRTIHILDTSVYLVILKVPKYYTEKQFNDIIQDFKEFSNIDIILLPFGTIIETGNHIADAVDGRKYALIQKFVDDIRKSLNDQNPYTICGIPKEGKENERILHWIENYEANAIKGLSLIDSICIDIFNKTVEMYPSWHVRIWSYDRRHLEGYSHSPD